MIAPFPSALLTQLIRHRDEGCKSIINPSPGPSCPLLPARGAKTLSEMRSLSYEC